MQRLYSTFANGWPGYGLLALRCASAAYVLHADLPLLRGSSPAETVVIAVGVCAALALIIGCWTLLASVIVALLELWLANQLPRSIVPEVLTAVIAFSLTLLGPGAWSIDARLYGRRRISFDDK